MVLVRSRRWLVENVSESEPGSGELKVALSCAEDDAQGQQLEVYWELEPDRALLDEENWNGLAAGRFDPPRHFAAFLNTLRWNCVTATDPNLFQSPFRAGIKIDAYQMEPLRKALRLPRVTLFIADDTGLGKTIEAGLVARELLLRKKAKTIVVAAPPSVLEQWKSELEARFGWVFEILDRAYLARVRRERGFGVNPWRTHSRFLISHQLLGDSVYKRDMEEWLGPFLPGSLLILDEAHHAAPSSGGKYGIESQFTKAIRDLAPRFEHRLFLSATPHNGHSNSFSTLLELLDPHRFTRGVEVRKSALQEVMVRRLKEDIRAIQGGFPKREVVRLSIDGLPADAPELTLSNLLEEYRIAREERMLAASATAKAASGLLVVGLQQRLLSSIEAFARTLKVHRETAKRHWEKHSVSTQDAQKVDAQGDIFLTAPDADDERGEWSDEDLEAEESEAVAGMTEAAEASDSGLEPMKAARDREMNLLERMQAVAEAHRYDPDAKTRKLLEWIRDNLCPGLPPFGESTRGRPAWNNRRVLIFTENREGTKRYLKAILEQATAGTDQAEARLETIDGLTSGPRRREIQQRFNTDPARDPLRILLATDAAREGLNFQAHCTDLFHFDLPWNPGRIEQRNGRIDRKLQPADTVRCHYFVLPQRAEDRVLEVLIRKTETIKKELGSLSKVIDDAIERKLRGGIRHRDAEAMAAALSAEDLDAEKKRVTEDELESARDRSDQLHKQIKTCQDLLDSSGKWAGFSPAPFREALSCALELMNADPLEETTDAQGRKGWRFPPLDRKAQGDPTWAATLDTLRVPRKHGEKVADWRRDAPIRPVIFEDAGELTDESVHLHLEQRVAQRLLARFRSQGFIHQNLSRSCFAHSKDAVPRVVLLGRLSLYGKGAERLHEELVPLAARWVEPGQRKGALQAYGRDAEAKTLELLDKAFTDARGREPNAVIQERLLSSAQRDIAALRPLLQKRALEHAESARALLAKRGEKEAADFLRNLEQQQERVRTKLAKKEPKLAQMEMNLGMDEQRQLEADIKSWRIWLERSEREIITEPPRVREFYSVRASRIEPVGLVYLWPESN